LRITYIGKDYLVNSHDARMGEQDPDVPSPAGTERRQLSFRASGLTIELEITDSGGYQRLTGQLIPRQPAVVQIRAAGGVITVQADPLGRFSADTVPLGPVSLRCRLGGDADRSPVVTGWITLGM
jgi:hypothetical protein